MPVRINAADFRAFAKDLKAAEPAIRRSLRRQLREAANVVRVEAESLNVSKQTKFSTSITQKSAAVVAKGPAITALEEGNGRPGTWRHPIFGNWDIHFKGGKDPRVQKRHPYLTPALESKAIEAVDLIGQVIDDGFRVASGGGL